MARKKTTGTDKYDEDVQKYLDVVATYDNKFRKWQERVQKIETRYRDEGKRITEHIGDSARMNILWANVEILKPAMFSVLPKPDVIRRWRDNDPMGRVAALILERALEYELSEYDDFEATMTQCVFDNLLAARATAWVRYDPTFERITSDELQISDDQAQEPTFDPEEEERSDRPEEAAEQAADRYERLAAECAPVDYIGWRDFGHEVCRTWDEVGIVWRIVYMTQDSLQTRFGDSFRARYGKEITEAIPADADPNQLEKKVSGDASNKTAMKAKVYELWDKHARKVFFFSKSFPSMIEERDDPLGLESFFPCPRPLFGTITTNSLEPVPDYAQYQDLATELDIISDRIDGLIKALKISGVYCATYPELQRLFTEAGNNDLIPVKDWTGFAAQGGLEGAMDMVDLKPIYEALQAAYEARKETIDMIYQITGMGDLMRFDNDPQATATAERLKGQYGSLRLRARQKAVVRFATEIIKLKAQLMCSRFSDETLLKIGGVQQMLPGDQALAPQAMMLLRNQVMRGFRIEISSDALVQMDEQQEKADRLEFLEKVSGFLNQAMQAVNTFPQAASVIVELFKFGVTGFKVGKTIEGLLDQAADQLRQNPPKEKPDPETMKLQGALQVEQLRSQSKAQEVQVQAEAQAKLAQIKGQVDIAVARATQEAQGVQAQQEAHMELVKHAEETKMKERLELARMAHEEALKKAEAEFSHVREMARIEKEDEWHHLDAAVKLVTAELSASTTLTAAQVTAAREAEEGKEVREHESAEAERERKHAEETAEGERKAQVDVHGKLIEKIGESHKAIGEHVGKLIEEMRRPKKVVRDKDGKVEGVE